MAGTFIMGSVRGASSLGPKLLKPRLQRAEIFDASNSTSNPRPKRMKTGVPRLIEPIANFPGKETALREEERSGSKTPHIQTSSLT